MDLYGCIVHTAQVLCVSCACRYARLMRAITRVLRVPLRVAYACAQGLPCRILRSIRVPCARRMRPLSVPYGFVLANVRGQARPMRALCVCYACHVVVVRGLRLFERRVRVY